MPRPVALSAILSMLACPVCHGSLLEGAENLVCQNCHRSYPIVDGIPVLIADRAELSPKPSSEEPSQR